MAKQIATTKQTSGAGFGFEDKVAAQYAIALLEGSAPLMPRPGSLRKIEFQKRVDGYFLDDLVLTLEDQAGTWQCSLSVKSNVQFGATSAPMEFVVALWETYLHEETSWFNPARDLMGLITAPLPDPAKTSLLQDLLPKAHRQEPQLLDDRLLSADPLRKPYVSSVTRALFISFACPESLAIKYGVDHHSIAALLKHVIVQEFDFGNEPSFAESHAVQRLQYLLADGTPENALNLWSDLLRVVRRENEAGGYLDRSKLLHEVRQGHNLKQAPDYERDWNRLVARGGEVFQAVADQIGGRVRLQRADVVDEVVDRLVSRKLCGVIGPSGTGKSVVTKFAAMALGPEIPVLWFGADEFVSGSIEHLAEGLRLQHGFSDLLDHLPARSGVVVIDGLERLSSDAAYLRAKRLLGAVRAGEATSPWMVLFSCQVERWEYVQAHLIRIGLDPASLAVVEIPPLSEADIKQVQQGFPRLSKLLLRPHLSEFLRRPKVLDILAAHSAVAPDDAWEGWAEEPDLIDWYWSSVILSPEDGPVRSAFLQRLAERQADLGELETPLVDLLPSDVRVLRDLERSGVCRSNRSERVIFDHDLIGDWCRQRVLLGRESRLDSFAGDRVPNPFWHQAFRLYGLYLLEGDDGPQRWLKVREKLPFLGDLLLDAIIMSCESNSLLEKLWPALEENEGHLFQRLMNRFLHVSTYPDPSALLLGRELDASVTGWMRAKFRLPIWNYWLGMLRFLHTHLADVVRLAPLEVARASTVWLSSTNGEWPLRREAAGLAVAVGEATLQSRLDCPYRADNDAEEAYRAALVAATELPDAVADFALRACARRLDPEVEAGQRGHYVRPGTLVSVHSPLMSADIRRPMPEPWCDGPMHRVDDAFQTASLVNGGLASLMRVRGTIASEVILAALIREPRPRQLDEMDDLSSHEDVGLDFLQGFSPPLYDKGPFWLFLRISPRDAIDCIIRLVDFATERWVEDVRGKRKEVPTLRLLTDEGERTYVGGMRLLGWYRNAFADDAVASALMALEHWIYEQIRSKQDVGEIVGHMLDRSTSCALLGMLWEVARFEPALLRSSLRPLLTCAELYEWENQALLQGLNHLGLFGAMLAPPRTQRQIQEWEGMAHRTVRISALALRLLLFDSSMTTFFLSTRDYWRQLRDATLPAHPPSGHLNELMTQFDRGNWRMVEAESGRVMAEYVPPEEFAQKNVVVSQALKRGVPLLTIIRCRAILRGDELPPANTEENLFTTVQELYREMADGDGNVEYRTTAVVAGIAVLAVKCWDWLSTQPERAGWCKATLLGILRNPPPPDDAWSPHDQSGLNLEDFAAEAIVPFWADASSDPGLRLAVAQCAMAAHYSAVAHLTHSAFQCRDRLGSAFDQLVVFVLRWAACRHDIDRRRYPPTAGPVDIAKWFTEHGGLFVDGTLPADWGNWGVQALRDGEQYVTRSRSIGDDAQVTALCVRPRIDQLLLSTAFASILLPSQAASDVERTKFVRFWDQALECVLGAFRLQDRSGKPVLDPDLETRGIWSTDHWFTDRFVDLILQLRPEEHPDHIWGPILDLGAPAHEFVEAFLRSWFLQGLNSPDHDRFVTEWKAMVDHAARSPIWGNRKRNWRHWNDFWTGLLGFSQHELFAWQDQHAAVIQQMMDVYAGWIPNNLSDGWTARRFLQWLDLPATKPIRLKAVSWLLQAAGKANEYWWDKGELVDLLAGILEKCWSECRDTILADRLLLSDYRELVALLVGRQSPLAMYLQDRMGGRAG